MYETFYRSQQEYLLSMPEVNENYHKKTGVEDPKRQVTQSVSWMLTHTGTCHVYRMDVWQIYAI